MRRRPNSVIPRNDIALLTEAAANLHDHRWTQWLPAVLVVAHPLDAHGISHRLGKNRGIRGSVIRAVVTVAAGGFEKYNSNVRGSNAKELRNRRAQLMGSLRCRPDCGRVTFNVGQTARRANRSMKLVRPLISRLERLGRARQGCFDIAVIRR